MPFPTPGDLPSMYLETSLAIQWLKFHISTLGGMGAVPGWGAKIPHTGWQGKKKIISHAFFSRKLLKDILSLNQGVNKKKKEYMEPRKWESNTSEK